MVITIKMMLVKVLSAVIHEMRLHERFPDGGFEEGIKSGLGYLERE